MQVIVRVHEAKTDKLAVGQKANVTVEGVSDRAFTGTVTKIAVLADTQNRWLNPDLKEYETEITLDPSDVPLKPGVTAYAEILVEQVEARAAVPVQAVYTKGSRRYVFQEQRGDITFSEVQLGSVGLEWAELEDGVAVGEQILLAFGDDHKRLIPDLPADARRSGWPSPQGGEVTKQDRRRPPSGGAGHPNAGQQRPGRSAPSERAARPAGQEQDRDRRRAPERAGRAGREPAGQRTQQPSHSGS
jgi:HlyD family secretion protein